MLAGTNAPSLTPPTMTVTGILHLDGDCFPLCARTRKRGYTASEWLQTHLCHVQAHATVDEQPLVNRHVDQGVARITEQCKGQPPGQRCCDPEWSADDPRIVNLFTDTRPEELERAMHIPVDEFVECVKQARNCSSDDDKVRLAIKLWNDGEYASSSEAGAMAQNLQKQRQQKQKRKVEQVAELTEKYGEAWFPLRFRPTRKGSQPKNNHVISNIYNIIRRAETYNVSPQSLWEPGGLLLESCRGGKFDPQAAKIARERAKTLYPESHQGYDGRGPKSLSTISFPYDGDNEANASRPPLLTTEPRACQQSPDAKWPHVPLDQAATKAVPNAKPHFSSKASEDINDGKESDSERQAKARLPDSSSILVLDDNDIGGTQVIDKGLPEVGLHAYLQSPTREWTDTPLDEGMKALCVPLAAERGYCYLHPLWFNGEKPSFPRRCFNENGLKRLLVPLHTRLKPPDSSNDKPRGHWSLAVVTGTPEAKSLAVTLYDSLHPLGQDSGRRLAEWLESHFGTNVSFEEKVTQAHSEDGLCLMVSSPAHDRMTAITVGHSFCSLRIVCFVISLSRNQLPIPGARSNDFLLSKLRNIMVSMGIRLISTVGSAWARQQAPARFSRRKVRWMLTKTPLWIMKSQLLLQQETMTSQIAMKLSDSRCLRHFVTLKTEWFISTIK